MDALARDRALWALWARWRSGDRAAGSQLLAHYEGAIAGLIHRLGVRDPSEAEDVYGDLVVNLAEYKDSRELESSFFGLARRMVISLVSRRRERSQRLRVVEDIDDSRSVDPAAEDELGQSQFYDALLHCLDGIGKPIERDLFRERFLSGWDNATLAERFQKSRNHVAVLLHRAVRHMRSCLSAQGFEPGRLSG